MNDIEKRARQLLAAEYTRDGLHLVAADLLSVRLNAELGWVRDAERALRAIVAALTPPEGYVLVPVELPVEMEVAFMEAWVSKRRCVDDPEMQDAWAAALAARPKVSP